MKIFVQGKLWNYLSDLLDFFLNERVYHGEGVYCNTICLIPPEKKEMKMSKIKQCRHLSRKNKLNNKKFSFLLQIKIIIVYHNIILALEHVC